MSQVKGQVIPPEADSDSPRPGKGPPQVPFQPLGRGAFPTRALRPADRAGVRNAAWKGPETRAVSVKSCEPLVSLHNADLFEYEIVP